MFSKTRQNWIFLTFLMLLAFVHSKCNRSSLRSQVELDFSAIFKHRALLYSLWTDCVSLWGSRRNKTIMSMTTQMCQMRHTEPFIVKRILRFWPVFLFVGRSFNLETKLVDLHPDDQPPKGQWLFKSIQSSWITMVSRMLKGEIFVLLKEHWTLLFGV